MKVSEDKDTESSKQNSGNEYNPEYICTCNPEQSAYDQTYVWYPKQVSIKELEYVRRMECEFTSLQRAVLSLTTQFARLQFGIRQTVQAEPFEQDALLRDLEHLASNTAYGESDELPRIERDSISMGDVRRKQHFILNQLHQRMASMTEADISQFAADYGESQAAPKGRGTRGRGSRRYSAPQSSEPDYNRYQQNRYTSGPDSEYSTSNKNRSDPWRDTDGESDRNRSRSSSTSRKGLIELCLQ
ncbi:uncharacterized protein Rundc1_2 [Zeugodacus cucurbitae]|uniref:uncharacterized protein Rundc1_2 n=1 Tax=Zeugodacus cucurbitae TaxID=28588 RepID=UPI000596A98C|nr:uncharacterized protein Rundc1_2 [Zeugodacus cucurbitae]